MCVANCDGFTRGLEPIDMEVCYWALLFMPLVILHHFLNVFVQLANKRGFKQTKNPLAAPPQTQTVRSGSIRLQRHHRLRRCDPTQSACSATTDSDGAIRPNPLAAPPQTQTVRSDPIRLQRHRRLRRCDPSQSACSATTDSDGAIRPNPLAALTQTQTVRK
jgi:hypothetical protein